MQQRNLDGYYFMIVRDGKLLPVCLSDMTHEERRKALSGCTKEALIRLCIGLADALDAIGNQFDISCEEVVDKETKM